MSFGGMGGGQETQEPERKMNYDDDEDEWKAAKVKLE